MDVHRKGIILAGGSGTRLFPITNVLSKQLLHVYDKPMIYYPLSTLMLAGIREILLISTPEQIDLFKKLLGDGSSLGLHIEYKTQKKPNGIAEALIIGETFLNQSPCLLILGDNIFHGDNLSLILSKISKKKYTNTIFGYEVKTPSRYGVLEFDSNMKVLNIEEKPILPKTNYVIPGLYFYDNNVSKLAKTIKPSKRGELEITDLNLIYMSKKKLDVEILGRGTTWIDAGTFDSLLDASMFISSIQKRQGSIIGCPEEIAFKKGWISKTELNNIVKNLGENKYSKYLFSLIN